MRHLTIIVRCVLPLCLLCTAVWAAGGKYSGMKVDTVTAVKTTRSVYDGVPISSQVSGEVKSSVQDVNAAISDLNGNIEGSKLFIQLSADVLFDFDKAAIKPTAASTLKKVALIIRKKARGPVTIIGHTDSKGTKEYNQSLSLRRAESTRAWLLDKGGAQATYQVEGRGESEPIAANTRPDGTDNPDGRAKNRRVDILIQVKEKS